MDNDVKAAKELALQHLEATIVVLMDCNCIASSRDTALAITSIETAALWLRRDLNMPARGK